MQDVHLNLFTGDISILGAGADGVDGDVGNLHNRISIYRSSHIVIRLSFALPSVIPVFISQKVYSILFHTRGDMIRVIQDT